MEHIYFQPTFGKTASVDLKRCFSLCGRRLTSDPDERWGFWLDGALEHQKGALEHYTYEPCDVCELMLFSLRECYEKSFAE